MRPQTPLLDALRAHRDLRRASFHTPGHKGAPGSLAPDLLSLDFTELPDTDSLYHAEGAILRAEERAAALFGAARTLLSAGGCSLCIQAMIRLAAPEGGEIVCARALHRSAVNAMALLGVRPVWSPPGELEDTLAAHPQARALYVTSPDYYGRLADIPALAAACRARGIPLIVDNAHGAHLLFTDPVLHPLRLGAAMTACSAHKTMNVLTGGAWLNIGDARFAAGAKAAMALFGSTSPSYPVMASLDNARAWMEQNAARAYPALQRRVRALRERALALGIEGAGGACDPTRLTLRTASIGLSGTEAARILRGAGVEPEYADGEYVVLIATPFNAPGDFERVDAALPALARRAAGPPPARPAPPPPPPARLSLREAVLAPCEAVPLARARGRVAAEAACPCPPGVPVVMPGEEITPEALEFLRAYGFFELKVIK